MALSAIYVAIFSIIRFLAFSPFCFKIFGALLPFIQLLVAWMVTSSQILPLIWSLFAFYFAFRYTRLVVSTIAFLRFRGRAVPAEPTFSPRDVTVVCASLWRRPDEHIRTLQGILDNRPARLIVVTSKANTNAVITHCAAAGLNTVEVIEIAQHRMGKRVQMIAALKLTNTPIVAFCDDDIEWSHNFLEIMLGSFNDPQVGAAGPIQRTVREGDTVMTKLVNRLAIGYLERRNFNTGATNSIDGAVSTLSGRTNIFRTELIKTDAFYTFFNDPLNHDDDKNLTRWIYSSNFKIHLQFDPRALIRTTNEITPKEFLDQCIRWARGHWRGNYRVMTTTSYWYDTHKWSMYAVYIGQFQSPALLVDYTLYHLLFHAMRIAGYTLDTRVHVYTSFITWIFITKIVKMVPHFLRYPADVWYTPVFIIFSYLHGIVNWYALFTMNTTSWGNTRAVVDHGDDGDTSTETTPLLVDLEGPRRAADAATAAAAALILLAATDPESPVPANENEL